MTIIWQDVNLKKHTIDLTDAVSIKIDGFNVQDSSINKNLIRITSDDRLSIEPTASNSVIIRNIK